jgi:Ca2+-transporting ATPase
MAATVPYSAHTFASPQQAWHIYPVDKTLTILASDAENGLSTEDIEQRLQHYGKNELEETLGRKNWEILLDQFKNIMLILLIVVALVSGILDVLELQKGNLSKMGFPFKDTIAILLIVILNGILGYLQESRAEKALAALKKLSAPKVQAIRNARRIEVDAGNIVPGDIILLEAGTKLCADGQILEAANLQIRESALTGEAYGVTKSVSTGEFAEDTPIGDRLNMVFMGTEVLQGRGKVIVTNTGMTTELGKIAQMLQAVESEPTPLQQRMTHLGNVLVFGSLLLVALVIGLGVLDAGWGALQELVEVSLSMAVAVVPEGLPAVITVTLALGTQRMVKRHALIRKLPAVETLGSVNVICSDKTGTLTQNKMVVREVETLNRNFYVTGDGYTPVGDFLDFDEQPIETRTYSELQTLLISCGVCNDATLTQQGRQWNILGDPTEGALLVLVAKARLEIGRLTEEFKRVGEIPFSSERKRMSVICRSPAGMILVTKGSPELILERCQAYRSGSDSFALGDSELQKVLTANDEMAKRGLRVLGFAYKPLDSPPANVSETLETELIWLGLVGIIDAPRPEVKIAVAECRQAGIRPIMITGDHQFTAMAIAKTLGIAQEGDRCLSGRELDQLSQNQLEEAVDRVSVYARVSPEHKLRIVQALQKGDKFVAMTGDGVNDAPALKQADIGIAMGITGTDVSKEASDMILLDDNFATIVAATEEGRVVYSNIRHFIKYILGSNIGEVLTIAATPLLGFSGTPLTPLQILWMNLVTDGLPALALAVEPADVNVMRHPPFSPKESIFARGLGAYIVRIGIVFSIISITQMIVAVRVDPLFGESGAWKTMVFTTLCLAQMGHAISARSSDRLSIEMNPVSNPYLWLAVVVTTILQLMLVYVPHLRNFFGTQILTKEELFICLGFSTLLFVWVELEKLFIRWYRAKRG